MASYDGYGAPAVDFSMLGNLPDTYRKAQAGDLKLQQERSLADLGKQLASGDIDYRQAAGIAAQAGRTDLSLALLTKANERQAYQDFTKSIGGDQPQPQAPQSTLATLGRPQPRPPMGGMAPEEGAPAGIPDQPWKPRTTYSQNDKIVSAIPEGPGPNQGTNIAADNFGQRIAPSGLPAQQPPVASPAAPTVPQASQGLPPQANRLLTTLANPDATPGIKQAATLLLQRMLPEDDQIMTTSDGNIIAINKRTHQVTPLLQSQSKPFEIGQDAFGGKRMGTFGPGGKIVPLDLPPANNGGAPSADVSGDEFLKTQDPQMAALVKKVANYEVNPQTFSTKGGHREQILSKVAQYDPTYDQTTYPARADAYKKFSAGPQGNIIRSFDVSIAHLNTLGELATALENKDMKLYNTVANKFKDQFGGTAPSNFDAAKQIVGDEIVKAIVGAGGGVGDREKAQAALNSAKTPDQLKGVIQTYKTLMAGQLQGLKKQYTDTTGRKDFDSRLSPETLNELKPADAPYPGAKKAADGKWYVEQDGKYFRVDQ